MATRTKFRRLLLWALLPLLVVALPATMAKKSGKKDPVKRLYATKCAGGCHRLYKPKEYTGERWAKILDEMAPLAKLTDDESKKIKAYLIEESTKETTLGR